MNTQNTCCEWCEDTCGEDHGCQNPNCTCHHPKAVQSEVELTGELIHSTFRIIQGEMTPEWHGLPWEELNAEQKKRYDYVALELNKIFITTYQHRIEEARKEERERIIVKIAPFMSNMPLDDSNIQKLYPDQIRTFLTPKEPNDTEI